VGGTELFSSKIRSSLRILQLAWHPYSDTHLGVLSTDGVFRLYDLSLDVDNAEQEYHLDAGVPARRGVLPLARAVGFAFGGEHLWDRFTVCLPILLLGLCYFVKCFISLFHFLRLRCSHD
jgi:nuclear pore complex protein Nup88